MNPILTLLIAVSLLVSSIGPASIAPGSLMTAPKPDVDKAASGKTEQLTLDTSLQPQKVVDEKPAMQEEPEEPQISPYQIVLSVNLLETSSEKIANLTWQVDGWQADAGLSLALTFPDTLHLTEKSPLQPGAEPGTWNMLLTSAEGSIDLRVNSNIKLPLEIRGELLVHDKIIDTYITLLEGALNRDSLPRIGTAGGRVSGIDGRVSVVFPSGALAEEAGIQIQRIPPQASGWVIGNGSAFEILADGRTSRKAIHRFAKSFIIQVDYDPELVEGDERSLVLTSFDEASQEWLPLPSWVDEENHILYARSNHLSVFNPSVHTMELAHLPQMKNYAISQFTGAATYSFPLQLPPGPGGLQPELSLSYNSQAVDIATGVTQASWVGMGWSLETGAIVRNMNGTSDYLPDDTFTMMVGTFSSQLVPGLDGKYHTEEESFWRIQKNGDDTWTAWDKTGMVYSFGIAYPSNAYTDLYYDMVEKFPTKTESRLRYETYDWENCDNAGQVTWAWPLVKVQNPFQSDATNYLLYTYWYDHKNTQPDTDCDNQQRHLALASYPQAIYYPNRRYRVHFIMENRFDYQLTWAELGSRMTFMKRRLDKIQIEHDADGNGTYEQTLRTYDLVYDGDGNNQIFPGLRWSAGWQTPTLEKIQEYVPNSSDLPLPDTTFSYSDGEGPELDGMHLLSATNGYGGKVTFSYDRWFTDLAASSVAIHDPFYAKGAGPWSGNIMVIEHINNYEVKVCTGYVDENGDPICTAPGTAYRNLTYADKGSLRPGGVYRVYAEIGGTGMQLGLRARQDPPPNGTGAQTWVEMNPATPVNSIGTDNFFVLPVDAANVDAVVRCTNCGMNWFSVAPVITRYRVIEKRVFTETTGANPGAAVYQYEYQNEDQEDSAQVNAIGSLDGVCPAEDRNLHRECLTEARSQFLGHARVKETYRFDEDNNPETEDPILRMTVTSFYQDQSGAGDPLSSTNWQSKLLGKVHQVDVLDVDNYLLSRTTYQYDTANDQPQTSQDSNIFPHPNSQGTPRFVDLSITWPYLQTEETRLYPTGTTLTAANAGSAPFSGTRTEYNYEKGFQSSVQYGNVTHTVSSSWDGSAWQDDRLDISKFNANTTGVYLVGLPAASNVYSCPPGSTGGDCFDPGDSLWPPADRVMSSVMFLYDGSFNWNAVPTAGALTGKRTFLHFGVVDPNQLYYRHVAYQYDTWGNRTGETVYLTDVLYNTTPSGPALTTQSCYGAIATSAVAGQLCAPDAYHTYKAWEVNAAGQFTRWSYDPAKYAPTVETATNGGVTRAMYDSYGRMRRLCLPGIETACLAGHDAETPSIEIEYGSASTTAPYVVDLYQKVDEKWIDGVLIEQIFHLQKQYDGLGNMIETRTVGAEVNGETKDIVVGSFYDGEGRLVQQSLPYADELEPEIYYTITTYDALGRPVLINRPDGTHQDYAYGVTEEGLASTTVKGPRSVDNAEIETTRLSDAYNQLRQIIPPEGPGVNYTYDALGQLTAAAYGTAQTILTYDYAGNKRTLTDPSLGAWSYDYDTAGRLTGQRDALNQSTCLSYDALSRVVSKLYPEGTGTCPGSGAPDVQYWYDGDGVGWEDGFDRGTLGSEWTASYPAQVTLSGGNVNIAGTPSYPLIRRNELVGENEAGHVVFQADTANALGGFLLEKENYGQSGYRRWELYYQSGYLRYRYFVGTAYSNDVLMAFEPNQWYEAELRTGADGIVSVAVWKQANPNTRAIRILSPGQGALGGSTAWRFSPFAYAGTLKIDEVQVRDKKETGQRTKIMEDESYYTTWRHDLRGLLTEENKTIDETDYQTQWAYNDAGLVTGMTYPGGEVVTMDYLPQLAVHTLTGGDNYVTNTQYDAEGRVTSRELGNGLTSTYGYYLWNGSNGQGGRLETLVTTNGIDTFQNLNYSYDPGGNITQIADAVASETLIYTYDTADRLSSDNLNGGNTFTYDSEGNLSLKGISTLSYATPANHRVTGMDGSTYGYDANGNMTTRVIGGVTYTLTYDRENRLVGYSGGSVNATFTYDDNGNRVKGVVTAGGTTTTTVYVGAHYEMENETVRKYYSAGATRIAVRVGTEDASYLLADHLGSTSVAVDTSGQIKVGEQRYTSWGEIRYTEGTTPTRRGYTGQYNEPDLGILFYNARWMDPALGRFLSADTLIPEPGSPLAWDRYSYIKNNPVNGMDPSGHCPICIAAAVGAVIGGGVNAYIQYTSTGKVELGEVAGAAAAGAVSGAVLAIAAPVSLAGAVLAGGAANVLGNQAGALTEAIIKPSGKGIGSDFAANGGIYNGSNFTNLDKAAVDFAVGGAINGLFSGAAHALYKQTNLVPDPFAMPKPSYNNSMIGQFPDTYNLDPVGRFGPISKYPNLTDAQGALMGIPAGIMRQSGKLILDTIQEYTNQRVNSALESVRCR